MARNRTFVSRGQARSRRETSWLSIDPDIQALDASAAITHVMTAAELAKRPFTVVRTRMTVMISTDQLAADEQQIGAVGLAIVSSQAVLIGVTAVPTPITDLASDKWFVHQPLISDFIFATAAGFDSDGGHIYEIDSKAMRKVNDDEEIIVVAEALGVGSGVLVSTVGRLLIKEH